MSKTFPKPGDYHGRRTGPIVIQESRGGALMAYVPYVLLNADVNFTGNQSICLVTKDGSVQAGAFENLHKVFPTWGTNDPFELQDIPLNEDERAAEFVLADGFEDSYLPENSETGDRVSKFAFKWLNPLGGNKLKSLEPAKVVEVRAKFESRWNLLPIPGGSALSETPVAKIEKQKATKAAGKVVEAEPVVEPVKKATAAPTRKAPTPAKKEPRKMSAVEVSELLSKKMFNTTDIDDTQQEQLNEKWFGAMDELFGANVTAETPEQFGQLADKLGV